MPFALGDRVEYVLPAMRLPGSVTHVGNFIGVTLDAGHGLVGRGLRAFSLGGYAGYAQEGYSGADSGTHIELIEHQTSEPTMPETYPPEPKIGYGSFDLNGRPIEPGHSGDVRVGYGILHSPKDYFSAVYDNLDDESFKRDLEDYLTYAKTKWEDECRLVDWLNVENKWEALEGCRVRNFQFYSDHITMHVSVPDLNRGSSAFEALTITYAHTAVVPGISPIDQIYNSLNGYTNDGDYAFIEKVEGEVITNHDGLQWSALPRYLHLTGIEPVWTANTRLRANLMRNLDTVRAQRDSLREAA